MDEKVVKEFKEKLETFCNLSFKFGEFQNELILLKNELVNSKVWIPQNVEGNSSVVQPSTNQLVPFNFQYSTLVFDHTAYGKFEKLVERFNTFFRSKYLTQYFNEQVYLQNVLYELLEEKDQIPAKDLFILLKVVLDTIRTPKVPLYEYTLSILKEFAYFIGYLLLERVVTADEGGQSSGGESRSKVLMQILETTIGTKAYETLVPIFRPQASDLLVEDFVKFLQEKYQSGEMKAEQLLDFLQRIPFDGLKAENVRVKEMQKYVFTPLVNLLKCMPYKQPNERRVFLHLCKTLKLLVDQYPSMLLETTAAVTRLAWPARYVFLFFCKDFDFAPHSIEFRRLVFREMFNLFNSTWKAVGDKAAKVNQFLNVYYLPWLDVMKDVHAILKCGKKEAEKREVELTLFPFLQMFVNMAKSCDLVLLSNDNEEDKDNENPKPKPKPKPKSGSSSLSDEKTFFTTCVHILFLMAFKAGSRVKTHLGSLGGIRKEALQGITDVINDDGVKKKEEVKMKSERVTIILQMFLKEFLPFLLKTQPRVVDKLFVKFFSLWNLKHYQMSKRDVKTVGRTLANASVPVSFKIDLLRLIPWKDQKDGKLVFVILDVVLGIKEISSGEFRSVLEGFTRGITSKEDAEVVEKFLKEIEYKTDSHGVYNAFRLLYMLLLCQWEGESVESSENEEKIAERMSVIKTNVTNSKIGCLGTDILCLYVKNVASFKTEFRKYTEGGVATALLENVIEAARKRGEVDEIDVDFFDVEKEAKNYVKYTYLLTLMLLDEEEGVKKNINMNNLLILDKLIGHEFLGFSERKIGQSFLFRAFIKAVGESKLRQQATIMKMVQRGLYMAAFIFTVCFPTQTPPLESTGETRKISDDEFGGGYFHDVDELLDRGSKMVLNTQVESALWISAEIGQKLIEAEKPFISLFFWQLFFKLYFELESKTGRKVNVIFPAYLRQRLNRSFEAAAEIVRKKDQELEKVAVLFQSFCSWDSNGILGGTTFIWKSPILQGLIIKALGLQSRVGREQTEKEVKKEELEGEKETKANPAKELVYGNVARAREFERKPFFKEISRYNHFRMKVEETFSGSSVLEIYSLDQQRLFSDELIGNFNEFVKTSQEYSECQAVYKDIVRNLYQLVEQKQKTTLKAPNGEVLSVEFTVKKPTLSHDGSVVQLMDANRLKLKDLQMKLLETLEKMSFLYSSLTRITNEMQSYRQFNSTALTFHFSVLPFLLDLRKSKHIEIIYPQMVQFVASLGKKFASGHPKIQMELLSILVKSLEIEVSEDEKDVRSARKQFYSPGGGAGFNPELIFEENNNFDNNRKNANDYLDLLESFIDFCGENIPEGNKEELYSLANSFEMSNLFYHVHEVYPAGSRISMGVEPDLVEDEEEEDEGEIDIGSLAMRAKEEGEEDAKGEEEKKKSMQERMNIIIRKVLGSPVFQGSSLAEAFLTKCVQICFPTEMDKLLQIILLLSQEGRYTGRWEKILFSPSANLDFQTVSSDLALSWIKTINMYQPYNNPNIVSSVVAIKSIVLGTKLHGVIKRSSLEGENIESILSIFSIYFGGEFSLSYEFFLNLLLGFKNYVSEFPFLIDIVWEYYFSYFHPFAIKNSMKFRQQLASLMVKFPFENAIFHAESPQQTIRTMQTLYQTLPFDPVTVCNIFNKLDWSFMRKTTESTALVNFVFLICDIRIFDHTSLPKWVEEFMHGNDEENPLWMKLNPNELAACLEGKTMLRMIIALIVAQKGGDPAVQLLHNTRWLVEVCLNLKSEVFAVALAHEIENIIGFWIKTVNGTSSWTLKTQHNVEFLRLLFALASNYYFNSRIVQSLFIGTLDRFKNDFPVLVKTDFKFDVFRTPSDEGMMREKFSGMISQFVTSLTIDEILKNYLKLVPMLIRIDMQEMKFFCPILEDLIRTFLKLTNESEGRSKCCQAFSLSDELMHNEIQMSKLIDGCIKYHCPLLLTMILLKQIEDIVVNKKDSVDNLRNTYFYCLETALQYIPSGNGFDYMFVLLFMVEIIQSDFFDLSYTITKDLVAKFKSIVEYLAEKLESDEGSSSWKKLKSLLKKNELPWKVGKHPKVPEQLAISAKLMDIYLEKVLKSKKSKLGSGMQLLSTTNPSQFVNQNKLTKLSKLSNKYKMYGEFFKEIENLKQLQFDLFALKLILSKLFPLCDYLFK